MDELLRIMNDRILKLRKAIKVAKSDVKTFPEGRLRVSNCKMGVRYYKVLKKGDSSGEYLPRKERKLAAILAQKDYNKHFLNAAEKELMILERTFSKLSEGDADTVYEKLVSDRKVLVSPYIQTDEMYINEWNSVSYNTNNFMEEEKRYDTMRGEKVRSKSESILADMFNDLGIPYRYEQEFQLKNGQVRYPDFTLLNIKTKEEIYLEHFGLLEYDEYRKKNLRKLDEYRENGIYMGKNLLITYETEDSPLDIRGIRKMLKSIFL
ncbi:MAG: hypothetical protein K6B28_02110 [Lachnospiraceae bacterium]|nr:hypothetical protein [Lachnospiraceae bacterium]